MCRAGAEDPLGRGTRPPRARSGWPPREDTAMTSDLQARGTARLPRQPSRAHRRRRRAKPEARAGRPLALGAPDDRGGGRPCRARARAQTRLPDVVLLDLRLPDMEGRDVARALREDERTAHIPVVALTALEVRRRRGTAVRRWILRLPREADRRADVPRPGPQVLRTRSRLTEPEVCQHPQARTCEHGWRLRAVPSSSVPGHWTYVIGTCDHRHVWRRRDDSAEKEGLRCGH